MLLTANIFQPLIDVFEAVLKFFHNNVGVSWGFSIVLLTICIRVLLLPLTLKQFHSMQKLQRLQPELKAIQNKYKEDKQRQQQELMKFYKDNDVNPLGSCLPLVAQLPVFISLFYMLRKDLRDNICPAIQAKYRAYLVSAKHYTVKGAAGQNTYCGNTRFGTSHHAGFLFIHDLTNTAKPLWVMLVLIALYVGTQLGSSLLMSSPTMDKTQRQIMLFMPLLFVLFVIRFPAGVLVYWITTNTWTIVQQYIVKRRIGPLGPPAPAGGPALGGGGGNGGAPKRGSSGGGAAGKDDDDDGQSGNGGGLGGLLRGRAKAEEEAAPVGGSRAARATAPPPPPRKKKKRSGRRR
jgi:YidC/Oxa1 family membrane protein insertase